MNGKYMSLVAGFVSLGSGLLYANPTGGVVTNGTANFSDAGNVLTINQAGQRVIIQWDSFSIAAGEVTNFNQPAGGTALNRVMLANPSEIFGQLNATGNVILINPNGILVGAGGQIDAAGFMASTLDVPDAEFLAGGDLRFTGSSNSEVTNLGSITARQGDIFLLAASVSNVGTLTAPNGTVGLAAGDQILVSATGDERVFVEVSSGGKVEHRGEIRAAIAELKAMGTDPNVIAVSVQGLIEATGVQSVGGKVYLSGAGGKVFVNAPVEARPAPEGDAVSGTLIKIDGGDLEFRDAEIQAFGPGQADVDVDAVRDILMVNATLATSGATSGAINMNAGNDITLRSENGGNAQIGAIGATNGANAGVSTDLNAGGTISLNTASLPGGGGGYAQIGNGGVDRGSPSANITVRALNVLTLPTGNPIFSGGYTQIDNGDVVIMIGTGPPASGGGDDGITLIGDGVTPVPSVPIRSLPGGPTSLVTVTATTTTTSVTTPAAVVARTAVANAVVADTNQRAPRIEQGGRSQSSVPPVVTVRSGGSAGNGEQGGVDASIFTKMVDPTGSRNFIETRIGGQ